MPKLVNIGEVIVNGVVFDPKNSEALRTMDVDRLLKSVAQLFDLLDKREVDYVLVGGIAMLVHVEGRNTQDIDLIVSPADLDRLPEITLEDQNPEFARGSLDGLQVNLLLTTNPLFDLVRREQTITQTFQERQVRCATVEGLLLLKLFALPSLYRQGSFDRVEIYERDITMLIRDFTPDMPPLLAELGRHLSQSDASEVSNIVTEIEERIARSQRRFRPEASDEES